MTRTGRACRRCRDEAAGHDQAVAEPGAGGVRRRRRRSARPSPSATKAEVSGMGCSGVQVATMTMLRSPGVMPGRLDGGVAGGDGQLAVVSPGPAMRRSRMPGALDDPLVGGVDPAGLEVVVGQPRSGTASPSRRRPSASPAAGPRPMRPPTSDHDRRSQATGWPSRTRSPARASMPTRAPPNGLRTGRRVRRALDHADGLPGGDHSLLVDSGRRPPGDGTPRRRGPRSSVRGQPGSRRGRALHPFRQPP